MAARNDDGLYAKARSLFISKATMDDLTGRATPRQTDAASRPFDTEPANGVLLQCLFDRFGSVFP